MTWLLSLTQYVREGLDDRRREKEARDGMTETGDDELNWEAQERFERWEREQIAKPSYPSED